MHCSFDSLEAAVLSGDCETAQFIAGELARNSKQFARSNTASETASLNLRVVDAVLERGISQHLTVSRLYTAHDLKMRMFVDHGFSLDKQICIVNGKVVGDTELLFRRDDSRAAPEVCLYLKSDRKAASRPLAFTDESWRMYPNQAGSRARLPSAPSNSLPVGPPSAASTVGSLSLDVPSQLTGSVSVGPSTAGLTTGSSKSSGYVTTDTSSRVDSSLQPQATLDGPHQDDSALRPTMTEGGASEQFSSLHRPSVEQRSHDFSNRRAAQSQEMYQILNAVDEGHELVLSEQESLTQDEQPITQVRVWSCPECTLDNELTRPGCEACGTERPAEFYVDPILYVPQTETERRRLELERYHEQLAAEEREHEAERTRQNYLAMTSIEQSVGLVSNNQPFLCPICFSDVGIGEGVVLRECLHEFCRPCLEEHILHCNEPAVICPYMDDRYSCVEPIPDRELRLLTPQLYETYLQRSLATAEAREQNSFHCQTPDCAGWCVYEDSANFFTCPICHHSNCLTCKAIHENMDCKQYQDDLKMRAANDEAARKTQAFLEKLLKSKKAMKCPGCQVVLQKKDGCDWIRCSVCKIEVCWVRKMSRWGPKGEGDLTAGCKCNVGGKKCHPRCRNCH